MKKTGLYLSIVLIIISCKKEPVYTPNPVDLISPESGETEQPLNATLTWTNPNRDSRVYLYDVYLGKSQENMMVVDSIRYGYFHDELKYECKPLERNTKYFWKVRIKVDNQYADSKIYDFTTSENLPSIKFQGAKLMIYPSDIENEHDSLIQYSQLKLSGATNWTDGAYNTVKLMQDFDQYPREGMYLAARKCNDLDAYGYSDWYLPSVVEMDSINHYLKLTKNSNDIYWTSNEYEKDGNWGYTIEYLLPPKNFNIPYNIHNKFGGYKLRCIRRD